MRYSGIEPFLALLVVLIAVPSWSGQIIEPLKEALELHEAGKIKEAIALYDRFIKTHPKRAEGYFNRGNAYYDLGQNQHAVKDYSEAIRLGPKDGEAYLSRGNAYRRLKQDQAALADYNAAIKFNPPDARAYINRGSIHFDARR
jgi:tetratricopeptide (TPR) repeat protein